ncbi:MAG: M23 family metallopeptidase [Patescibacteria group bacterium]
MIFVVAGCSQTGDKAQNAVVNPNMTDNPADTLLSDNGQVGLVAMAAAVGSYDAFPSQWKFPFSGSWQISVGYDGNGCYGYDKYHTGSERFAIDWNLPGWADNGKPVLAAASGWVKFASSNGCWGNTIVVEAGGGKLYRVAHLSGINVRAGWWVPRGYVLGWAGNTGCSEGSHLHFSVYYPASYAGYGNVSGPTIPQNGISGQNDLRICSYYSSGQ